MAYNYLWSKYYIVFPDSRWERKDRAEQPEGAGTILRGDGTGTDFHFGDELREVAVPRGQLHGPDVLQLRLARRAAVRRVPALRTTPRALPQPSRPGPSRVRLYLTIAVLKNVRLQDIEISHFYVGVLYRIKAFSQLIYFKFEEHHYRKLKYFFMGKKP